MMIHDAIETLELISCQDRMSHGPVSRDKEVHHESLLLYQTECGTHYR